MNYLLVAPTDVAAVVLGAFPFPRNTVTANPQAGKLWLSLIWHIFSGDAILFMISFSQFLRLPDPQVIQSDAQ